jgi:hypothetical protein
VDVIFVDNMAENADEIEELQLRLESQICGSSVEVLSKFSEHVEVNVEGLRKIQISKRVREKIESKVEASEDKKALKKAHFKIFGVVGGDRQKDCLSFVSLSRQIDAGVKSGYQESEIVEAVIRAVSPSLKLRPYLEMMDNLSLVRLKQILRAHFKEKTGTELYTKS